MAVAHAQAGTAAHLAPAQPEQAQKILADLAGTTSSALLELQATVGVLRHPGDPEADSLQPAPGLDRLPELVATCESAGLTVTVTTDGTAAAPPVPGGGYGLMGMRERAQSVGGTLHAGPRPEGGFEVTTALPLQPHTQAQALAPRQEATP